jgi:putative tricarboxylic transport membrane protein
MPSDARRHLDPPGILVAALLALGAAVIIWDANRLALGQTYGIGPKAMPYVVAVGLALLALGNLVTGLSGERSPRESTDPKAILRILGGLAAVIAIIGFGGGFILATTFLFAMTAAAFGRVAFFIDLAIGFALSLAAYLMFDKLLTLSLPAGPLERLL